MTTWRVATATDQGSVRRDNQDAVYADDRLVVVADGMGGHAAGDVAAQLTIDLVARAFEETPTVEGLFHAIERANHEVFRDARENPEHFGMGTTVIGVGLTSSPSGERVATMVHVGDSRMYQLRDGALRQVSDDHSVAEEWVRMGRLTPAEAAEHPRRHQLTRAVGVEETIAVDVLSLDVQPGDRLLLCSDGLSNELSDVVIAQLASAPIPLDQAVRDLVNAAKAAGGRDNITVALIELDTVSPHAEPIRRTMSSAPAPSTPSAPRPRTHRRRRRLGWRVWASAGVVIGVFVAFVAIVHWYAYSTYYLANDAGVIAVYQGQPHGVLWFGPVKVSDTNYSSAQLRSGDQTALDATIAEPSLESALHYATYLHTAWTMSTGNTSLSTTTTTRAKG